MATPSDPSDHASNEKNPVDWTGGDGSYETAKRRFSIIGAKSPGVQRIEAVSSQLTFVDKIIVFLSIFLIAYAYGLDGQTRFVFQTQATSTGFEMHSYLATINVLRGVIAAAAQPTAAKIADVFGRVELIAASVFFYIVGTIIEASAPNLAAFCAGAVIYQVGYTMILLLVEVIIGDITSMKNRVVFSYIPALPFIINTWVSGNVTGSVLSSTTWRWGIGMWAIIYFVCSLPIMIILSIVGRRARKNGALDAYTTPFKALGAGQLLQELFWQLDVIGIVLMIAVFALILVPLSLGGSSAAAWKTAHVIAPLVVGFCTIPVFIVWEIKAKHPLVPFHLLKDRGVWAALLIAAFLNFIWYMQGDFLYTVLVVAFDFDVEKATRVLSVYSFVSVVVGVIVGFIIIRVRRLKPFAVAGTCLFLVAFGLLIRFRGGSNKSNGIGVIAAQVVLGIAGGMFPYVVQASIQAATQHEHLAVITGLYLACYNIGFALGSCLSGGVWNTYMPNELGKNLNPLNETLASAIYSNPLDEVRYYPVGTIERTGIITSYQTVQRLLCIIGVCLCVPLIVWSLLLRNPKLSDEQSQPEAEKGHVDDSE